MSESKSNSAEFRGLKIPYRVERLLGGKATVVDGSISHAYLRFGKGQVTRVSWDHLFTHYKPL